ncbi:MAG TPA: hypothetical protein VGV38_16415, partial [Pyrinomonadaceae bacterium]|nr:hypothetical protein [Pyrinomonadaceae bacterium]
MRRPRPLASLLLSLAVYAAAAFVPSSPIVPAARACPAPAPMPLRALYTTSERVVVASVGATVVVKKEEGGYEHVRTLLNVSETLKGDAEEYASYLHRRVWPSAEGGEEDPFKFGNTLLLFLIPNQEGGYVVADLLRGVKHLPESDLRVYVKRVKELDAILRQEKPDEADIVEWLVRCAEEKATRWEGAYELWLTRGSLTQAGSTQDAAEGREPAAGPSATPPAGAAQTETPPPGQPVVLSAAYEAPTEMPDEPSTAATPNAAPPVGGFGGAGQQLITPPGGVVLGGRRLRAADFPAVHAGMLTAEQRTRLASALFAAD